MKNVKTMAMTLALVAGVTGTAFAADIRDILFIIKQICLIINRNHCKI